MAESVDINLASSESISDSWSLGCDITIEEAGTDIQEIRLRDIDLIGDIYTGEVAIDINPELANVMELDINVTVDGVNPSIVEAQIVTYENILKITDLSKETTNETRYAASARAAKKLYDLICGIDHRVDVLESAEPSSGLDLEQLQEFLDENKYIKEEVLATKIEEKIGEMFYWYDEAHTIIGTDHTLFSLMDISANGLHIGSGGSSGDGSGEGKITSVLGLSSFGTVTSEDYSTTFNAYAIDSLYKRIVKLEENGGGGSVDVDLSDYYTIEQTQSAITEALKPYAKTASVEELEKRVATLEEATNFFYKYNDNTICTDYNLFSKGEISANGLSYGSGSGGTGDTGGTGSSTSVSLLSEWPEEWSEELSSYALSAYLGVELNTRLTNIEALGLSSWIEILKEKAEILNAFYVTEDGASIGTDLNFFSTGEVSADGLSLNSGKTLLSSELLGTTIEDGDSNTFSANAINTIYTRLVTLEENGGSGGGSSGGTTTLASLSFGNKAYNGSESVTLTASDLGALTEHQTIYALTFSAGSFSAGSFSANSSAKTIKVPTQTSHLENDSGYITSVTSSMVTSALGYTPADSNDLDDYLPLSGGTMTGSIITPKDDNMGVIPAYDNYGQIGSSSKKYYRMYATTFHGALSGNATSATSAKSVPWSGVTDKPTKLSDFTDDLSSAIKTWVGNQGYATESQLEDYLPLIGGDITGDLTIAGSLTIGGFVIDVYEGALRLNGNAFATGEISADALSSDTSIIEKIEDIEQMVSALDSTDTAIVNRIAALETRVNQLEQEVNT